MDRQAIISRSELEHILIDESAKPKPLPLSLLEHITSGFSDDNEIGYGGFAVVYKGMLDNGTIAVKKLSEIVDIDEKKFSEEVRCLMKAKHKNIVRFLGYCSDTQGEMLDYKGELVFADVRQRLLCFEYLPRGSLDKQITDASRGLEWRKRYQIINGICDGLCYLHQKRIVHLDLKPENILLDDNMMPKITDFGLSRCLNENQTRTIASKVIGTMGYLAPEFYVGRQITFKSDIYSLGMIIIKIVAGEKGYYGDNVLESWRNRLEKSQEDTQIVQVRVCIEIAIECNDFDPTRRPDTQDIIDRLRATENAAETGASSSSSVAKSAVVPPGPTIGPENAMASAWERLTKELCNMTDQNRCFSSLPDNNSNVHQITDIQETTSDVEEALIIERTEGKQKIEDTLSGSIMPDFIVHPVHGFGDRKLSLIEKCTDGITEKHEVDNRGYGEISKNENLNYLGKCIGLIPDLELCFLFEPNKDIRCCLQLINKAASSFIAFNINTDLHKYRAQPNKGIIAPYSKLYITLTLRAQEVAPPNMQCVDVLVVQSIRVSEHVTSDEITQDFLAKASAVDEVILPIVYVALDNKPLSQ